jgi:predicted AAA+ superfamily ATPase
MDELFKYSNLKLKGTDFRFTRYLLDEIHWGDRLIGIRGARGTGKTTLMLQHLKRNFGTSSKALYVSLDSFYFTKNRLFDFIEQFHLDGGKVVYLDEVHRYPDWSRDIKNIYDLYDDIKIVFSGSSALQLYKLEADLSRRAAVYDLHELSFREYLALAHKKSFEPYSLKDILKNHIDIAGEISKEIDIVPEFKKYLKEGAYPFFIDTKGRFYERLISTVNLIIETDLQIIEKINFQTTYKLRKLIALLADTVPFKVNISDLSRKVNLSRDSLLRLLDILDKADLIKLIRQEGSAGGYLTKPDKIYLNNSSLLMALSSAETRIEGSVRETFFMNQLLKEHRVASARKGDFLIDKKYLFEVGGANKTYDQIAGIRNSYIAADNLIVGYKNKIPLWLFGFLY